MENGMDPTQAPDLPENADAPLMLRPDPEKLKALGRKLASDFEMYERDRRTVEMRWAQNLRQFLGKYDPEIAARIPKERSRAYPKLTRIKCVSMVSRLMNLLFPSSEKNWGVEASPVPNLSVEDLQQVLDSLQQDPNAPITDDAITDAVNEFAAMRAENLEVEIEDQLAELGGGRMVSYIHLNRKVLMSGIMYGMGVLKGPQARTHKQRRWRFDQETNKVVPSEEVTLVPQFEFVPLWDYYPDMSANYTHQMDGQFQRMVMSRAQVRKLADNSEFFGDVIKKYLADHQSGNYKQKPFESELKAMGVNPNVNVNDGRKYEIILWDGGLSGHFLRGAGIDIPEDKLHEMVSAVVWVLDGVVIRANLNPWAIAGEENPISSYHHFIFEEDETLLTGTGLPFIMRDSQLGVCASARMILDNSGVVCGPQLEVNRSLLVPEANTTDVSAYRTWERDDESPATVNTPAVRSIQIDSHIDELLKVNELFRNFADQETFVNPQTGGDMQKGPSEPFRTAAGASMIQGQAALPFKDVVRNHDIFTESVIGSIILFNKYFNPKPSIKGDFQPVARGSTSLIAKEVRGMGYDSMAQTLQPEERLYIDWQRMLRERIAVRDMDPQVMVDRAEAKRREEAQAESQQKQAQQQEEVIRAEVRKTLAEAVKNLTQSDKNAAGAQAASYNAILLGLEKGITPTDVAAVKTGASNEIPEGVVDMKEMDRPPAPPKGKK